MATRVDGLAPSITQTTVSQPKPKWRWLLQAATATLIGIALVGGLLFAWLTPNIGWPDRLSLLKLARPARYLVLFQNPRELRSTGGFLGSFAEIELGWFGTVRGGDSRDQHL